MRILHVITSMKSGGAERLLVDMLPSFRNGGKNQVELLLFDGADMPFLRELESRGIKIHKLSQKELFYDPRHIFRMVPYMSRYDIIHTHNTSPQLFTPIAKLLSFTTKKLVTTEHSTNNRRRGKWWLKPIDKWMYNRYAAIVCITEQARHNLEEYIGQRDNIYTIINGLDTSRFAQPIKDITGHESFVITMVARFRPEKDHKTVLEAMKLLPENYRLQFVGDGEGDREDKVKGICTLLGLDDRVTFMGACSNVPEILAQSDVAVMSSLWEGFGLAAAEAMAAGRPVIATDVTGLRDVVNGAGLLFPVGDAQALANEIKRLCGSPEEYQSVARRCQERASHYDISKTISKYLNLYSQLFPEK